eukprot:8575687-Lingulodinium_polyedra.AAC.1
MCCVYNNEQSVNGDKHFDIESNACLQEPLIVNRIAQGERAAERQRQADAAAWRIEYNKEPT